MDSTQAAILRESVQGLKIGGWSIAGFFGNGKSAVVLPAEKDGALGAIKIFHPELVERYGKAAQLERINREKSLVGASHANLVKILDGGECAETGYLFVVMERIPYRNLHEAIHDIPSHAIPSIISQVASAARFLEDRGMAHRDIKPENIAISDDYGKAILLDLGVLLPIGLSNLTDINQRYFIGTLRYSSPEFLLRQEDGTIEGWRAVTFYQLGAVLHDLLMKRVIFEEYTEPFSMLVEAVKSVVPKIYADDAKCVALANRCLIKNPATRLELVSWSDFIESAEGGGISAIAARERIRQRQRYYMEAAPGGHIPAVEAGLVIKHALDDLCNRFESRVAALLNDLQCFPLRATKSEKSVPEKRCTVCIFFERDSDIGLYHHLNLVFEIDLIDENSGGPIFRASAAACLSNREQQPENVGGTKKFHVGDLQSLLDSPALESQFLEALEQTYRLQEQGRSPIGDDVLQLELGEEELDRHV